MKSTNLRNKPVDKRRLNSQDKQQYRSNNRSSALAKARQRRGQMAWEGKVNLGTQEKTPGTGGFTAGIHTQQQRVREEGQKLARSKELRSSK